MEFERKSNIGISARDIQTSNQISTYFLVLYPFYLEMTEFPLKFLQLNVYIAKLRFLIKQRLEKTNSNVDYLYRANILTLPLWLAELIADMFIQIQIQRKT